jgi:septal ring factor EnvC (AmiA/AmiB activator)
MNETNQLPQIVTAISFTIAVILLTLIFSYSYLLSQIVAEKKQLTEEFIAMRNQLGEEREQRQKLAENNQQLSTQLARKEEEIEKIQQQLQATEKRRLECQELIGDDEGENQTPICQVVYKEVSSELIRQAAQNLLSTKTADRFKGFAILMNHLEYINDQLQRELTEFYLEHMDKKNEDGVYYATFVLSQLKPSILREYETKIREWYHSISPQAGWQRTSYRYCQLEKRMNDYSE